MALAVYGMIRFGDPGGMVFRAAWLILGLVLPISLSAATRVPPAVNFEGLLDSAQAVVVARIVSIDTHEIAYDGPIWIKARILKSLNGTLATGGLVEYSEGGLRHRPNSEVGEIRILLLVSFPSAMRGGTTIWSVHGRKGTPTVFAIREDEVAGITVATLRKFLQDLDAGGGRPARVWYRG